LFKKESKQEKYYPGINPQHGTIKQGLSSIDLVVCLGQYSRNKANKKVKIGKEIEIGRGEEGADDWIGRKTRGVLVRKWREQPSPRIGRLPNFRVNGFQEGIFIPEALNLDLSGISSMDVVHSGDGANHKACTQSHLFFHVDLSKLNTLRALLGSLFKDWGEGPTSSTPRGKELDVPAVIKMGWREKKGA